MHQQEVIDLSKSFTQTTMEQFQRRFHQRQFIGRGSGAYVECAKDKDNNDESVAIKFYNKDQLRQQCQIDVYREVKYLTLMNLSNHASYFLKLHSALRYQEKNGSSKYCLILQLCNRSLKNFIEDKTEYKMVSLQEKLQICIRIAQGIQALHKNGIIHRDLKPANILLAPRGGREVALIADFGHTRQIEIGMTSTRGSPQYVHPDLIFSNNYGFQWDFYSYGLIVLEVMTGKFLWDLSAQQKSSIHVFTKRVNIQLARVNETLKKKFSQLSDNLKKIIQSCLILETAKKLKVSQLIYELKKLIPEKPNNSETSTFSEEQGQKNQIMEDDKKDEDLIIPSNMSVKISQSSKIKSQNNYNQQKIIMKHSSLIDVSKQDEIQNAQDGKKEQYPNLKYASSQKEKSELKQQQSESDKKKIMISDLNRKQLKIDNQKLLNEQNYSQKQYRGNLNLNISKLVKTRLNMQIQIQKRAETMRELGQLKVFQETLNKTKQIQKSSLKHEQKQKLILLRLIYLKCEVRSYMVSNKINEETKKYFQSFVQKIKQLYKPILNSINQFLFTNRGRQQIVLEHPNKQRLSEQYKYSVNEIGGSQVRLWKNIG